MPTWPLPESVQTAGTVVDRTEPETRPGGLEPVESFTMPRIQSIAGALTATVTILFVTGYASGQDFVAAGGSGDDGGDAGSVRFTANRGVRAGGKTRVRTPRAPRVPRKASLVARDLDIDGVVEVADLDASPGDLDPDLFEVTTAKNFLVPSGTVLRVEGDV